MLATFLSLFLGWPRPTVWRRAVFGAFVATNVLLALFSFGAVRSTTGTAGRLAHHVPALAALGAGSLLMLAAATWLAWRYPRWAILLVMFVAPLRVPLPFGTTTSNLLVPLYFLLLAIAIAELVVRDRLVLPDDWRPDPIRIALAVMIAVCGVSALWVGQRYALHPKAFASALIKLYAFFLPFGVLYVVLYRYASDARRLLRLLVTFVAAGAVMAVIGVVQFPFKFVIINPSGTARSEHFQHTFRSNALFWDPNVFGRYLSLVMLVGFTLYLTARLARRRREAAAAAGAETSGDAGDGGEGLPRGRRPEWLAGAAVALAAVAFIFTFSRSSVAALLIGAMVVELAWLGRRRGLIVVGLTMLVLIAGIIGISDVRHTHDLGKKLSTANGINKITGGRYYLVKAGIRMFDRHPVTGIGLGGFPLAFPKYRTSTGANLDLRDSHTTPVTVAAEQGVIGLAAFAGLLVTFFATTLRRQRFGADRRLYLWQAGLVAGVLTILIHSLSYNSFFEDPYLWAFMALASVIVTRLVAPTADTAAAAEPTPVTPSVVADETGEIEAPDATEGRSGPNGDADENEEHGADDSDHVDSAGGENEGAAAKDDADTGEAPLVYP